MLESNSLLFIFCFLGFFSFCLVFLFFSFFIVLFYISAQKWGLLNIAVSDVASCLAVFVHLSLHAFSCLLTSLSFCLWFIVSLRFFLVWFSFFFFFFFSCHFWGSQSWGCLSCLSVTGRYTCQSLWLTALINLYPGSAYVGHENNISAPKWTLHLTRSVSFLLPRQLSALAELLRIEFMGMEHYYSFCCA